MRVLACAWLVAGVIGACSTSGTSNVDGGDSTAPPTDGGVVDASPIPATFFAITDLGGVTAPGVTFGTLGHPVLSWEDMEPEAGVFAFNKLDAYLAFAHQEVDGGVYMAEAVVVLTLTPSWAVSDPSHCRLDAGVCTVPPDNLGDWTQFITTFMAHYNGSSANTPRVHYIELWNEADNVEYWTGTPAQLVALAQAAYPIIKDGGSVVLSPSVVGDARELDAAAATFLAQYLSAGGAQYADYGAYHGYVAKQVVSPYPWPEQDDEEGGCAGSAIVKPTILRQVFDQNGMSGKPMFDTEGSFLGAFTGDPDNQTAWLARYYVLQAGLLGAVNLQLVSWFGWGDVNAPLGSGTSLTAMGTAYDTLMTWLVGASFVAPCAATGTVWSCAITRPGGYQAKVLWDTSQSCTSGTCTTANQPIGQPYVQYRDLTGAAPTPISGSAPVGAKPILVENQ